MENQSENPMEIPMEKQIEIQSHSPISTQIQQQTNGMSSNMVSTPKVINHEYSADEQSVESTIKYPNDLDAIYRVNDIDKGVVTQRVGDWPPIYKRVPSDSRL